MKQAPQDPHAPESRPPRHGRRLIQMLFRPNGGNAETQQLTTCAEPELDSRAEDASSWKVSIAQPETPDHSRPPVVAGKFSALKRKLFPSQNRRHPRQVPPLIISPISTPTTRLLPPINERHHSPRLGSLSRDHDDADNLASQNNNNNTSESSPTDKLNERRPQCASSQEDSPENGFTPCKGENDAASVSPSKTWHQAGRTLMDEDDDRDLEIAVAALDAESTIANETLAEMDQAIDDLRAWKQAHQQETDQVMRRLELEQERQRIETGVRSQASQDVETMGQLEMELELKRQRQQQVRDTQTLELRREAEAYQTEFGILGAPLDEADIARVEEALSATGDPEGTALSRLRDELFQLDVKQRQAALLQDLQGADNDLDMNIVDVQAFTSELDAILAQLDDSDINMEDSESLKLAG